MDYLERFSSRSGWHNIVYVISSDFWNGELAALFEVQNKHTDTGPYPSFTSFNAEKLSNG